MTNHSTLAQRAAAEAIGTFALVLAGCGAIVTDHVRHGALGVVGVGLVFFLVLLAAIAALGHISGAHFNPGVSLSFYLIRHLPARDLGAYTLAQLVRGERPQRPALTPETPETPDGDRPVRLPA